MNRCPQLSAPAHGSVEPCSNLPGQTCQFSCDQGYVLSGATTRTCNNDGTWTGLQTQCIGEFPGLFRDSNSFFRDCISTWLPRHHHLNFKGLVDCIRSIRGSKERCHCTSNETARHLKHITVKTPLGNCLQLCQVALG